MNIVLWGLAVLVVAWSVRWSFLLIEDGLDYLRRIATALEILARDTEKLP